jgi:hypothetical protein
MPNNEKDVVRFIILNIAVPLFLTIYFMHQQLSGAAHGYEDTVVKGDLVFHFLTFYLTVLIAPAVLLLDLFSIFTGWQPTPGSHGWQLKFFSKVLYYLLLAIFILQLIF